MNHHDPSNGYEALDAEYMSIRSSSIGVRVVREWASALGPGTQILDLGCGHGLPIAKALAEDGYRMHGVDASETLLAAYRDNVPRATTEHASVQESTFTEQSYDAILAWGLLFLLSADDQELVFGKVAVALRAGGSFLFTAPYQRGAWLDNLTQRESVSLGSDVYNQMLEEAGLQVERQMEGEAGNHYYLVRKPHVE